MYEKNMIDVIHPQVVSNVVIYILAPRHSFCVFVFFLLGDYLATRRGIKVMIIVNFGLFDDLGSYLRCSDLLQMVGKKPGPVKIVEFRGLLSKDEGIDFYIKCEFYF